jgi:hypothetical protein
MKTLIIKRGSSMLEEFEVYSNHGNNENLELDSHGENVLH